MTVYVPIELLAVVIDFSVYWLSSPVFTLLICNAFCQLQQVTLKPSLKGLRKSDFLQISIGMLLTSGLIAQHIGHFMTVAPLLGSFPKSTLYIHYLIFWLLLIVYSMVIFTLPFGLILVWMNNIEEYFNPKNIHDHEVVIWAETNIDLYK